jgi:hypothetical protein
MPGPTSPLDFAEVGLSYADSGGMRAPDSVLFRLREDVVSLATADGFPKDAGAASRAHFDAVCTIYLAEHRHLKSGEALRDDVWAFIASVLLPDVTLWRFSSRTTDRFHGGERNMFQRLWYRGTTFDRGVQHQSRWELVERLTEDAFAQIIERPSIRSDRRLARAIAEGWIRANPVAGASMERIMRRAVRELRVRNEIQVLSALPERDLAELIDLKFRDARIAEASSPPTQPGPDTEQQATVAP